MLQKRAVLVVLMLSCLAGGAFAQLVLSVDSHISIAPISIPINNSGVNNVGVTRLEIRPSEAGILKLSSISLQATTSGTFDPAWVSSIQVWFEQKGATAVPDTGLGEWDHGAGYTDVRADTGATTFNASGQATLSLDPAVVTLTRPGGATAFLYVVCNFSASASASTDFGCEVTSVTYGISPASTGMTANPTAHGTKRNMDYNEATIDASWRDGSWAGAITGYVAANASKVPVLKLDFGALDTAINATTPPVQLDKVRVHLTYGQDSWVNTAGVLLYADDGDGVFEPDAGDGAYIASATMSGGYALLDPPNGSITSSGKTYFVAVNLNGAAAQVGQNFGLNINNPSTDIIFADEIDDDAVGNTVEPEYAWVPYTAASTYEYVQVGYITSPAADPAYDLANTFIINPADDGTLPEVSATIPDSGDTDVSRNADITILFSKYMKESSVEDPANFTITGGISPSSFVYTNSSKTLVITLPTLALGTTYTATVQGTVEEFYGIQMGTDYTWTFTVEPAVYPVVLSTAPAEGETNVVLRPTITATFSEDVSGISGSSVKLYTGDPDLGGAEAPNSVTVSYNSTDWVATITLDLPVSNKLTYNTRYWVKVESDLVSDGDSLPLANQILGGVKTDKKWSFWTMPSTPPSVLSFTPADSATDVPIASAIQIVFSKQVLASSLTGNITVVEEATATPVSGTISPSAGSSNTVTFTPAAPLDYLKQYRVTVSTGITDTEGTALSAGKTWTFTTFGFTQATITNNRLGAGGGASQCLIFVPQVNPTDRVSVQVFTTTGKLVRTFYKNAAFSSVTVPIPWDGTNDNGKALGPGLYFVQIIAAGVKQTLKVLIVR